MDKQGTAMLNQINGSSTVLVCKESSSQELLSNFEHYITGVSIRPRFFVGNALEVLRELPDNCVDCCMTSPPYWGHRKYADEGIGLESDHNEYISNLIKILVEVKRVLKQTGSLWLNLGDSYKNKNLLGIPWRVALELTDSAGWILRNSVVWNKIKGAPDNSRDKLRNVHEYVFHFVKSQKYFYDVDAIRSKPKKTKIVNGSVMSATGVSGVRYKRQIELSTELNENEKSLALQALDQILHEIREGKLSDFRMIIRGQQRPTHSDSRQVSGRARELQEKGFYFLRYHPNGSKPGDVWDILPEDTQKRKEHYAPYPEDLCRVPILSTCPRDGIVLDPFSGTGTTMLVAFLLQRKSVGIDISASYIQTAEDRIGFTLL